MKEQIEQKLKLLMEEREAVLNNMEKLRADFELCRERVIELNGSIQATQEMFQMLGEVQGDTESKAESGSDTNEG